MSVSRSMQCRSAIDRGNLAEATRLSKQARMVSFIALVLGIAISLVWIIAITVVKIAAQDARNSGY